MSNEAFFGFLGLLVIVGSLVLCGVAVYGLIEEFLL